MPGGGGMGAPDDLTCTHQSPVPGLSAGGKEEDNGNSCSRISTMWGQEWTENQAEGSRWETVREAPQQVTYGHHPSDGRELRKERPEEWAEWEAMGGECWGWTAGRHQELTYFFPLAVESLNDNTDNLPENLCWKVDFKLVKFKLQFYYNYLSLSLSLYIYIYIYIIFMYILNAFTWGASTAWGRAEPPWVQLRGASEATCSENEPQLSQRDRCKELQSAGQPGQGFLNLNLQPEVLRELVWEIVSLENTASVPSGALGKITPITAPSPEHSDGSWANVEGSLGSLGWGPRPHLLTWLKVSYRHWVESLPVILVWLTCTEPPPPWV